MKTKQIWKIGNCLDLLPEIPDKSIDMILTDLPYGKTQNKWDKTVNLVKMWAEYERIIKNNGAILFTAIEPFTSHLIISNERLFRYRIVWDKDITTGFLNVRKMPLRQVEDIVVFYKKLPVYNPTKRAAKRNRIRPPSNSGLSSNYGVFDSNNNHRTNNLTERYPTDLIKFSSIARECNPCLVIHPTQKPVTLFEYLIKTYTNEGDWVHDSCLGSGTTLEACMNTNRNCIGFEISDEWEPYYKKRLKNENKKLDSWSF